jgi:hypothetical protein
MQNNLSLGVNDDEKILNLNINLTVNMHFNLLGVNENVKIKHYILWWVGLDLKQLAWCYGT